MSIFEITRDDLENFTIVANPKRTFSSGSNGITGSVSLFPRGSSIEKEVGSLSAFNETRFDENSTINSTLKTLQTDVRKRMISGVTSSLASTDSDGNPINVARTANQYLLSVNSLITSSRKSHTRDMQRFVPSFTYTDNTIVKNQIKNILMPYYRQVHQSAHWAYTNYHTLNFFTASGVPSDTAIVYPNVPVSGSSVKNYTVSDKFSFDFWINCRYTTDDDSTPYHAGTILHLSASYALSVISGSNKDSKGRPNSFRLLLQLSHSADQAPSQVTVGTFPHDLSFMSSDNSLEYNKWHHVTVRWASEVNNGTGSFVVDGQERGRFVVTSSRIDYRGAGATRDTALLLGNFYGSDDDPGLFFANDPARRDGLLNLEPGTSNKDAPDPLSLSHPLNAELHDIKIYGRYLNDNDIKDTGPSVNEAGLKFYVPPFFTKESPKRKFVGTFGGVLQTPFFAIDSTTDDPFNVAMSFGVGGHYLNNENFGREFVTGNYPRWFNLTGSEIPNTTLETFSANKFLYKTGSIRKRNLSILPCDNGLFTPNFSWLLSGTNQAQPQIPLSGSDHSKYVNDLGVLDLSLITLNNLISTSSLRRSIFDETGSIANKIMGARPDDVGIDPGEVLTIYQRTRDNSSNEVVYFDMSNLFYGERINPGSLKLKDSALTGSGNKVSITLKDDGYGNIYRSDALSKNATWNSVGNVFYNEGLMVIKSPNIPFFGKDQWEMEIEGEQSVHVLKVDVTAPASMVDSSSNPTYLEVSASNNVNDKNSRFVYITDIVFMDENLNVVMKTNLSQPVVKKANEKITFRPKIDY